MSTRPGDKAPGGSRTPGSPSAVEDGPAVTWDSDGLRRAGWPVLLAGLVLLAAPVLLGRALCASPPCSGGACPAIVVCASLPSILLWAAGAALLAGFWGLREGAYRRELEETEESVLKVWGPRQEEAPPEEFGPAP